MDVAAEVNGFGLLFYYAAVAEMDLVTDVEVTMVAAEANGFGLLFYCAAVAAADLVFVNLTHNSLLNQKEKTDFTVFSFLVDKPIF